jgi:hypothetical protein
MSGGLRLHPVLAVALAVALVVAAACSTDELDGATARDGEVDGAVPPAAIGATEDPARSPLVAWPSPDPDRPVVDLRFEVAADLGTVAGTERIRFRPDQQVCEVVLRAWPNKPATAAAGNALEVTELRIDGEVARPILVPAGAPAGSPATLIEAPLARCAAAGTWIAIDVDFEVRLGEGTDERLGVAHAGDLAWFGTAFPLLAWERGRGWARDEAVAVPGEMATSEAFELRSLEVEVPDGYAVLGVGTPLDVRDEPATGRATHRFRAPAVRDVTVTVGELEVLRQDVDGVTLHLGVPAGAHAPATAWRQQLVDVTRALVDHLGPMPYDDLWVSVLPDQTDGIEYAGAVQFGDVDPRDDRWLLSHELAHQWFYGLVGNNQARDPWLDEAFASFVQAIVDDPDHDPFRPPGRLARSDAQIGQPMTFWAAQEHPGQAYVEGVYLRGSDALIAARTAAGAEPFDAALRRYLVANAHAIATPDDVRAAFAHLPDAIAQLEATGAFVTGD